MSQTSQLYTLVPNVASKVSVTGQANRVKIFNDSAMYLRVYFGADAPRLPTDPGWHETVSPGDRPLLWITGGTGTQWWGNTGYQGATPFYGVIIIMPFFPVGAPTQSGGVVTGISIAYITAYAPDENAESGATVEAFVQAAKQGRYQSVTGGNLSFATLGTATDQNTPNNFDMIGGGGIQMTTTNSPNVYAANAAGQSVINCYIYGYMATLRNFNPSLASVNYSVALACVDNLSAVIVQNVFLNVTLQSVNFGVDRVIFTPAVPILLRLVVAQNALASGPNKIDVLYRTNTTPAPQTVGVYQISHQIMYTMDTVNQSPLFALTPPTSAFVFPWNATYNPQTY
jgi:hypothetical protein